MSSSPAQRLMSRRTRHSLPTSQELLQPKLVEEVPEIVKLKRQKAKFYYDKSAKQLPDLDVGQSVRMKPTADPEKKWRYGTCKESIGKRSYIVEIDNKQYRRNRKDLRATQEPYDANAEPPPDMDILCDAPSVTPSEIPKTKDKEVQNCAAPQNLSEPCAVTTTSTKSRTSTRVRKPPKRL